MALNTHVEELHASPFFVRAMAELRARDKVEPGWYRNFGMAPRDAEDAVEDGISFEELCAQMKGLDEGIR